MTVYPVSEHEIHDQAAAIQNGNLIIVTEERSPHWICSDTWGQEGTLPDLFALQA